MVLGLLTAPVLYNRPRQKGMELLWSKRYVIEQMQICAIQLSHDLLDALVTPRQFDQALSYVKEKKRRDDELNSIVVRTDTFG